MKVVSAKQMRELDEETIKSGVPGHVLMERAGTGAFYEIVSIVHQWGWQHAQHFIVLTGKGNNGGDGYVIARLLALNSDSEVRVYSVCSIASLKGDAYRNAIRLPHTVKFEECSRLPDDCFCESTIFIDCLLGTGTRGTIREPYLTFIKQVNNSSLPVVAIDIPSGINADSGAVDDIAVQADLTVTMGLPKAGLILRQGLEQSGQLRLIDIGIRRDLIDKIVSPFDVVFRQDIRPHLQRLPKNTHKGERGRIVVFGGSKKYPGAPVLTSCAALRAGGGLVSLAYPQSIAPAIRPQEYALIHNPVEDHALGYHRTLTTEELDDLIQDKDVLVVGPGLTRGEGAMTMVKQLLSTDKAIVLDADGLHIFAVDRTVLPRKGVTVLTPHPGEMKRLINALDQDHLLAEDRATQAKTLARELDAFIVLKGAGTVIVNPKGQISFNTSGSPALATGGAGDALAGIIAAFMCHMEDVFSALQCAVFVHGLAAELAPSGMRNFIADDILKNIGVAIKQITPFA